MKLRFVKIILLFLVIFAFANCTVEYSSGPNIQAPSYTPGTGASNANSISITFSCPTAFQDATIYYTADPSDPNNDPRVSTTVQTAVNGQIVTFNRSVYVKSFIKIPGFNNSPIAKATYRVTGTCNNPAITPNGATFNNSIAVVLSNKTNPYTYYRYTTDGSDPGSSGTAVIDYSGTVNLNFDGFVPTGILQLRVIIRRDDPIYGSGSWTDGAEASETFTFICNSPNIPAPSTSDGGTTYDFIINNGVTVGAQIYYTTDGSVPTSGSILYTGTFNVPSGTLVRAVCVKNGYSDSNPPINYTAP